MESRTIGSLKVTVVGLGCNNFGGRIDGERTTAVVNAAIEAGINFFDTADIYGGTRSEELLGRALGSRRKDVLVATKFGMAVDAQHQGAKPDYVRSACEDSLRRLGTDHIDLYQLHQPDASVPIADTLGALDGLVKAGKVREIGCSNFSVDQLREAKAAAGKGARFVSVQNEYSLLHRDPEDGVLAGCAQETIGFLPYFPLASGLLTGKYRRGAPAPTGTRLASGGLADRVLTSRNYGIAEALDAFAKSKGHTLLELAFGWLLAKPAVSSVIAGATSPEQVKANVGAAGWKMSAEELAETGRLAAR